jgi:hypothetical protein
VEGKVYDVPAGTTWDAVSSFYKSTLEKNGWTQGMAQENALVFVREKQSFTVNYIDAIPALVLIDLK